MDQPCPLSPCGKVIGQVGSTSKRESGSFSQPWTLQATSSADQRGPRGGRAASIALDPERVGSCKCSRCRTLQPPCRDAVRIDCQGFRVRTVRYLRELSQPVAQNQERRGDSLHLSSWLGQCQRRAEPNTAITIGPSVASGHLSCPPPLLIHRLAEFTSVTRCARR